ncbi:uncharacterized protein [Prorops nasuta]|uniref:uncharacterized protein n=1 Tax=Prorops nasuta TaxID=863751 RepID=UPI0034CEBA9D
MQTSEGKQDVRETPARIVCIAYRQFSMMTGMEDPTAIPKPINDKEANSNCGVNMVCTRRLFQLPPILFISSTLCGAYKTVKGSNETVQLILDNVENRLKEGIELVQPYANVAETPLKLFDNLVCAGFDFFEVKLPAITNSVRRAIWKGIDSYTCEDAIRQVTEKTHKVENSFQ